MNTKTITLILLVIMTMFTMSCESTISKARQINEISYWSEPDSLDVVTPLTTADDSISRLYNSVYSSYMNFFKELDPGMYDYDFVGGKYKFYGFTGSDSKNSGIKVCPDSSIAVFRPGKVYEVSVDEREMFVYWAKVSTWSESMGSWSEDSLKLSTLADLQHAFLLPRQMLSEAKTASIKQRYNNSVARRERLKSMANSFRQ